MYLKLLTGTNLEKFKFLLILTPVKIGFFCQHNSAKSPRHFLSIRELSAIGLGLYRYLSKQIQVWNKVRPSLTGIVHPGRCRVSQS